MISIDAKPQQHCLGVDETRSWLKVSPTTGYASGYSFERIPMLPIPSGVPYHTQMDFDANGNAKRLPYGVNREFDAASELEHILSTNRKEILAMILITAAGVPITSSALARAVNDIKINGPVDLKGNDFYKAADVNANDFLGIAYGSNMPEYNGEIIGVTPRQALIKPRAGYEANLVALGHVAAEFLQSADMHNLPVEEVFGVRAPVESSAGMIVSMLRAVETVIESGDYEYGARGEFVITTTQVLDSVRRNGPYFRPDAPHGNPISSNAAPILRRWNKNNVIEYKGGANQVYIADELLQKHSRFCQRYTHEAEMIGAENIAIVHIEDDYKDTTKALYRILEELTNPVDGVFEQVEVSIDTLVDLVADRVDDPQEVDVTEILNILNAFYDLDIGMTSNERGFRTFTKRVMAPTLGEDIFRKGIVDNEGNFTLGTLLINEVAARGILTRGHARNLARRFEKMGYSTGKDYIFTHITKRLCSASETDKSGRLTISEEQYRVIRRLNHYWQESMWRYLALTTEAVGEFLEHYGQFEMTDTRMDLVRVLAGRMMRRKQSDT